MLGAVQRLGVLVGRFNQYLDVLTQAADTLLSPAARPWLGSEERDRLFYEAASQSRQLVDSFEVWRWSDRNVAEKKLREICKGPALPPDPSSRDHPRNTLAELACAGLLQRKGFACRLTSSNEDVEAVLPGVRPFAVEAKRPAHSTSLSDNARVVRRQLGKRVADGSKYGLAVFAADRILGLAGGDLVLDRASRLDEVLSHHVGGLVRELQRGEHHLFPRAALGAILTTGAVFCVDPGFIVTISTLGFFCTGPEDDPLSVELYRAMHRTMDHVQVMSSLA